MATAGAHKCTECLKEFTRPDELKRHVASVHSDERPKICDSNGRRFMGLLDLGRHIKEQGFVEFRLPPRFLRTHMPVEMFVCPGCRKFLSCRSDFPRLQCTCIRAQSADSGKVSCPNHCLRFCWFYEVFNLQNIMN